MRSSSWNRGVISVGFRFWRSQLKNWSNTKTCTEHNVAGQTRLHKRTRMRAIVLNSKVVKALTFFMLIIPSPVLSDANLVNVSVGNTSPRNVVGELDPDDTGDCLSLGELDIVFRTDNNGPPNVGVVLTDPRGRRIGFDPVIQHAWQALPIAQGDINCDDLGRTNSCQGIVQICGPISGPIGSK